MINYIKKPQFVLFITILIIGCEYKSTKAINYEYSRIEISKNTEVDSTIASFIKPYTENLDKSIHRVLSYAPKTMHKKDGEMESTIGNLMADAIMEEVSPLFHSKTKNKIDFCLLNYGGIRDRIEKGNVTVKTAYKIMLFENSVVVLKMSGKKVKKLFSYLSKYQKAHPISGAKVNISEQEINATIQGKKFDPLQSYYVATSDYLFRGGDQMVFFENPEEIHYTNYKIRSVLIDYFSKKDTLRSTLDQRLILNKTAK